MDKVALLNYLASFVSDHKRELFNKHVQCRTRHITVAVENVFQPQNASAVLRTCDCFGVQDVHVIENNNEYVVNPDVALGASKWLNLHRYSKEENNTVECINALKAKGYKVIATTPHTNDVTLDELPIDGKIALLFGTEKEGLSDLAMEHADGFMRIPMYGFTESFNISVSAAIILHHLTEKLRASDINWQLSEQEVLDIKMDWVRSVVKHADKYEAEFLEGNTTTD
jgi:tRNA (guanosine-2'-O-)-methyltransferase